MVKENLLEVEKPEVITICAEAPSLLPPTTSAEEQLWRKKAIISFLLLTLVQAFYAGYLTLSKVALVSGIDPIFLIFYRNLIGFVFLGPAAYYLERDVRPKMTLATFGSFNLLALFGIVGNQLLFLAGLALTTPLFTAVAQNMVPVITFLMEKISFWKTSDLAKMSGTVICVSGAVTMSVYKGMAVFQGATVDPEADGVALPFKSLGIPRLAHIEIGYWALGVLCQVLNCTSWGLYLINQGPVLLVYPALLSMSSLVCLLGCIQVAIIGAAYEGTRFIDFRLITMDQIVIVFYGGIVISAINFVLQAWCVQEVGPFIVSLFSPVQTLLVAFVAILALGDTLYMGILIGGILIIGGFYLVIYGQQMEPRRRRAVVLQCRSKLGGVGAEILDSKQPDLEEPLLH